MIAWSLIVCAFAIGLLAGFLSQREQVHRYRVQRDRALRRQHLARERSFDRALLRLEGDLP